MFAISRGRPMFGSAPDIVGSMRAAKPPMSSLSLSPAKWWALSGRSPVRSNPRPRRRDHHLTISRKKESANQRSASARYAALGAGQCRGALVGTMSHQRLPTRQRQPQTKQGHAARPADERLLTDVQVPPPAPHIRRTNASAVDRNRRANSYAKDPCQQS